MTRPDARALAHSSYAGKFTLGLELAGEAVKYFEANGMQAKVLNIKNGHVRITGGVREVDFYSTTGTVTAAADSEHNAYKLRGAQPKRALERALTLAKLGW